MINISENSVSNQSICKQKMWKRHWCHSEWNPMITSTLGNDTIWNRQITNKLNIHYYYYYYYYCCCCYYYYHYYYYHYHYYYHLFNNEVCWWIPVIQDVLKTSWRRLHWMVLNISSRRLEAGVFKTCSNCPQNDFIL